MTALSLLTGVVRCVYCRRAVAVGPCPDADRPHFGRMARHGPVDKPCSGSSQWPAVASMGWLRLDVCSDELRAIVGPVPYDDKKSVIEGFLESLESARRQVVTKAKRTPPRGKS